jgi:ribosomal protein S18 acetylase RimI-like enzyme
MVRHSQRKKLPIMVAVDVERVVGWANLFGSDLPSVKHCVDFGMSLHRAYREKGLGTKLMTRTLKMAQGKYDSVVLFVFRKNKRARNLYEKMGFEVCGGTKRGVKLPFGYDDTLFMQKRLRR